MKYCDATLRLARRAVDQDQRFSAWSGGHVGGTAADNRLFVDAVIYRDRAGIPWRDPPERYGDFEAAHKRLRRWCKSGIFARIPEALAIEADAGDMSIGSTSVRTHQLHVPALKKRRRRQGRRQIASSSHYGGLTTKIHAVVMLAACDPHDAPGNPVALSLTPGHPAEGRSPRATDSTLYRERNLVERFFCKLKQYR